MDYLEFLVQTLNCEYLSDLRYRTITQHEALKLLTPDVDMFPLADYQSATHYLLEGSSGYQTAEEARQAVIDHLLHAKKGGQ